MLYLLGYVQFEVQPVNLHEMSYSGSADFAAKDVLGTAKPREFVGEGDSERTITGKMFPQKFGGLEGLTAFGDMMRSGTPQILVRGDGTNEGWWLITKVNEKHTFLAADGVGKMIEFDITLVKSPSAPSAGSYIRNLLRLFG